MNHFKNILINNLKNFFQINISKIEHIKNDKTRNIYLIKNNFVSLKTNKNVIEKIPKKKKKYKIVLITLLSGFIIYNGLNLYENNKIKKEIEKYTYINTFIIQQLLPLKYKFDELLNKSKEHFTIYFKNVESTEEFLYLIKLMFLKIYENYRTYIKLIINKILKKNTYEEINDKHKNKNEFEKDIVISKKNEIDNIQIDEYKNIEKIDNIKINENINKNINENINNEKKYNIQIDDYKNIENNNFKKEINNIIDEKNIKLNDNYNELYSIKDKDQNFCSIDFIQNTNEKNNLNKEIESSEKECINVHLNNINNEIYDKKSINKIEQLINTESKLNEKNNLNKYEQQNEKDNYINDQKKDINNIINDFEIYEEKNKNKINIKKNDLNIIDDEFTYEDLKKDNYFDEHNKENINFLSEKNNIYKNEINNFKNKERYDDKYEYNNKDKEKYDDKYEYNNKDKEKYDDKDKYEYNNKDKYEYNNKDKYEHDNKDKYEYNIKNNNNNDKINNYKNNINSYNILERIIKKFEEKMNYLNENELKEEILQMFINELIRKENKDILMNEEKELIKKALDIKYKEIYLKKKKKLQKELKKKMFQTLKMEEDILKENYEKEKNIFEENTLKSKNDEIDKEKQKLMNELNMIEENYLKKLNIYATELNNIKQTYNENYIQKKNLENINIILNELINLQNCLIQNSSTEQLLFNLKSLMQEKDLFLKNILNILPPNFFSPKYKVTSQNKTILQKEFFSLYKESVKIAFLETDNFFKKQINKILFYLYINFERPMKCVLIKYLKDITLKNNLLNLFYALHYTKDNNFIDALKYINQLDGNCKNVYDEFNEKIKNFYFFKFYLRITISRLLFLSKTLNTSEKQFP